MSIVNDLTHREHEILELVSQGKSNKDIAAVLMIAEHTVEKHLSNIYPKLQVGNRCKAAIWYLKTNNGNPV